ncbi:MAG: acyl-CoA dehydrogenase family protein [Deltaproteobacteria bacterium]|nr:acyl-CoA dehydrogenase family protein [Deltaproteobacteria bacterium]MCL5278262.1 acyl-CoA dehydrogenase family protein [Deltaproteobacteria bacterium]
MDERITQDARHFIDTVKRFVRDECMPVEDSIEETGMLPEALVGKMKDMGLFGLRIPSEYGGAGMDLLDYCYALKELSKSHDAIRAIMSVNNGIGSMAIVNDGTEEQKRHYLPLLASGEYIASFALTEPGAGSDASAIATTAEKTDRGWLLNGMKHFITNAPVADVFTVIAVTDREKRARGGISAFIVEKGSRGLRIGSLHNTMGGKGWLQAEVIFEDCFVPDAGLLGGQGSGFKIAMKTLNEGRLSAAASAIGIGERLLSMGIEYAKLRKQFGKPISEFEAIQWMLADSATELYAADRMLSDTAYRFDHGEDIRTQSSMTKLFATESAFKIADRVLQLHGGMGFMKETKVERMFRDIRAYRIFEGTSEIQRFMIARELLKD